MADEKLNTGPEEQNPPRRLLNLPRLRFPNRPPILHSNRNRLGQSRPLPEM